MKLHTKKRKVHICAVTTNNINTNTNTNTYIHIFLCGSEKEKTFELKSNDDLLRHFMEFEKYPDAQEVDCFSLLALCQGWSYVVIGDDPKPLVHEEG